MPACLGGRIMPTNDVGMAPGKESGGMAATRRHDAYNIGARPDLAEVRAPREALTSLRRE